jgi:NTE family protein
LVTGGDEEKHRQSLTGGRCDGNADDRLRGLIPGWGRGGKEAGLARIGLVLGAGGIVGHAYHAGVLRALHDVTGWDPRTADVIVGTSAGSHVGALLRAGLAAEDIAARYAGGPLSPEGRLLLGRVGPAEPVPPPRFGGGMAAPWLLLQAATRLRDVRLGTLAAAALPAGRVSLSPFAARIRWLFGNDWPHNPLWLPAVRLSDGRRVVFGQDSAPRTDVGTAVAASCCVPGWFAPVDVAGDRYVDGGAHSPTNLDLLAGAGLDLVIVSSPMSVARGVRRPTVDLPVRAAWALRLAREAREVRRHGTQIVAFQPTDADLPVMGLNAMSPARRTRVVEQSEDSARRRLAGERVRARLRPLLAA